MATVKLKIEGGDGRGEFVTALTWWLQRQGISYSIYDGVTEVQWASGGQPKAGLPARVEINDIRGSL